MEVLIVGIDLINACNFVKHNDFTYLWPSSQEFLQDSGYPFGDTTIIASYEPIRNLFIVERLGTGVATGQDLPEMVWLSNNANRLLEIGRARDSLETPFVTVDDMRRALLADTDWVIVRKQEQDLVGAVSPMSAELFQAVLQYRQALRDITLTYDKALPADQIVWPANPLSTT